MAAVSRSGTGGNRPGHGLSILDHKDPVCGGGSGRLYAKGIGRVAMRTGCLWEGNNLEGGRCRPLNIPLVRGKLSSRPRSHLANY